MTLQESNLQFVFNDMHWEHLLKFDDETDFKQAQEAVQGTKGVDFSGIFEKNTLVLIEVKNFRGYRIENKPRMVGGDDPLWLEIARKMRDAIAVIVGAARNYPHQATAWNAYLEVLRNKRKQLHLVLWLEQDAPISKQQKYRSVADEEVFRRQLKRSLKWLTQKVDVANVSTTPFSNSLTVSYL
ncbi:MAG: hypothetical protein HY842_17090 [Bacteroidetes bacterium]|nr:hypothetical protein [Bacteroidota bacterium]